MPGTTTSTTTTSTTDTAAITTLLEAYCAAAKRATSDGFKPIFHDNAWLHGYLGPELIAMPVADFYAWHEGNGPATALTMTIASIDIKGTIATARVELDNWTGHRFTDMFTLLKTDGTWQITSKVFHLHG